MVLKALLFKCLDRRCTGWIGVHRWDPTTKHNINKMEMVQRRAVRYVHSDWRRHSSTNEMMNQLKWQTLEHRRHTARLTMMYKIQHNLVDIPLNKYTQPARTHCATEHLAAGRRGHPLQLRFQRSRLQAYKHSFFISTIITLEQTHSPNNKCSLHRGFQTVP